MGRFAHRRSRLSHEMSRRAWNDTGHGDHDASQWHARAMITMSRVLGYWFPWLPWFPWPWSFWEKSNMSNRSPTAGMFVGTYGCFGSIFGLGRWSRLRAVSLPKFQLRSMNFTTEAWSL